MTEPTRDEPLPALELEVRGRVQDTIVARVLYLLGGLVSCLLLALVSFGMAMPENAGPEKRTLAEFARQTWWLLSVGGGSVLGVTWAISQARRAETRERLRDRLRSLSQLEQAQVLGTLSQDPFRETRALVEPLLAEFGQPREVVPTAAPTSRGDEVTPS